MLACMNCDKGSVFRDPHALTFYVHGTFRNAATLMLFQSLKVVYLNVCYSTVCCVLVGGLRLLMPACGWSSKEGGFRSNRSCWKHLDLCCMHNCLAAVMMAEL